MSGGGLGFTIGKREQKDRYETESLEQIGSVAGSIIGDVKLNAGKDVNITASEILAGKDIDINGQNVTMVDGKPIIKPESQKDYLEQVKELKEEEKPLDDKKWFIGGELTKPGAGKPGNIAELGKDELVVADKSFLNKNGRIDWDKYAPNGGYIEGTKIDGVTLKVGTVIDRYGSQRGSYTSPVGVSYEARALPYIENPNAYHQYRVIKPIDDISMGKIAPAFKQSGGGTQYELPHSIEYLIENKYLEVIN